MNVNLRKRWLRFNAVGLCGVALQLALLELLTRMTPLPVSWASALAVELTLLANFTLHCRFTWPQENQRRPRQLFRFHLGNGAVSLVGNTLLTPLLVHRHLPVIAADALAIAVCSTANFTLASLWIFAGRDPGHPACTNPA
jgi:putative flippase GtrA